jgi:hypothetical protein
MVFAGEFGAGFCADVVAEVCAEAKFATSNALHSNRIRVKLDARMRRAPKKILYQEALGTGEENRREDFSEQNAGSKGARAVKNEFS